MTVLDAYAVVAYLLDEAAAEKVQALLRAGEARLTATGLGEAVDRLVRLESASEDAVAADLAELGLLDPIPIDAFIGTTAGRLRARHYHRTTCAVSMADCQNAAAAQHQDEPLATADPALLDLCRAEQIDVIVLPASDGSTWQPTAGS